MVNWNSSPHPISDIRDWVDTGRLELRPDFQRREVWSVPARIMLMDTILRNIPMPKIFLASSIRDSKTYRVVIDGQQRISAILAFLRDEFSLDDPYEGPQVGRKFSNLDKDVRDQFLSYKIDFNEALNPSDGEVREVYSRVNKYTFPLTKQELRRADYPGAFLSISEDLAVHEKLDRFRLFSPANRRRYADVEFVSELLSAMLGGIQDTKSTLDDFYRHYAKWPREEREATVKLFEETIEQIEILFDGASGLTGTRFRQKADFYTMFLVIVEFLRARQSLPPQELGPLREDIGSLDYLIRPESEVDICRDYAIKCVSQANSAASRRWRHEFMKAILRGTFECALPDKKGVEVFYRIMDSPGDPLCPDPIFECGVCGKEIQSDLNDCVLAWRKDSAVYQFSNSHWIHRDCRATASDWDWVERLDASNYFF